MSRHDGFAPQPCIRWAEDPNHDAVLRIGSEAPRRRTHSAHYGIEAVVSSRDPATSNRHRRPVAMRADRRRNRQVFFNELPFTVRDAG